LKRQTYRGSANNTKSLRHCSNKYKLAREGEKDKEKDEDLEKVKVFLIFYNNNNDDDDDNDNNNLYSMN